MTSLAREGADHRNRFSSQGPENTSVETLFSETRLQLPDVLLERGRFQNAFEELHERGTWGAIAGPRSKHSGAPWIEATRG